MLVIKSSEYRLIIIWVIEVLFCFYKIDLFNLREINFGLYCLNNDDIFFLF